MRYEGAIYRPPSEAYSLILQVTIGCAWNRCTFCPSFKEKKFRIRPLEDVFVDLMAARNYYSYVKKVFLADGDALICKTSYLEDIYKKINELFPECESINLYARAKDILNKSEDDLLKLKKLGLKIVYIGVETGSPVVLEKIQKGETREQLIEAVKKVENLGIKTSLTFLSGIGGRKYREEHAKETGSIISEMNPSYVSLLTTMVVPGTKLYDELQSGEFELLKPREVIEEAITILENIDVKKKCVFRSNHASNYVALKGDLPKDKKRMIKELKYALEHEETWRDEAYRGL